MELKNRKALVTGGSVRIGRAIVEALVRRGVDVAIHYRSSASEAESLAEWCREQGVNAISVQADLVSESVCVDLLSAVHDQLGGCCILINNASVYNKQTIREMTGESLNQELWPNCFAPMMLTREFGARLSGSGDVINLLDRRIQTHDTSCVPYLLSKKMLAEFTKLAALEYAPQVRVNGVGPGATLPPPEKDDAYLKEHAGQIPLKRLSSPDDIAANVMHYLDQPSLTGQITFVDGGQHLLGADKV